MVIARGWIIQAVGYAGLVMIPLFAVVLTQVGRGGVGRDRAARSPAAAATGRRG